MIVECWAIIIIILAMCVIFMRANKANYALGTLPLVMVPFGRIFSGPLARWLHRLWGLPATEVRVAIIAVMLVLSCIFYGVLSGTIHAKRSRISYLCLCGGFSIILSIVMILNILHL